MHLVHSVVIIIIIMANAKCVLLFKWLINRLNITVSGRGSFSPPLFTLLVVRLVLQFYY